MSLSQIGQAGRLPGNSVKSKWQATGVNLRRDQSNYITRDK
jgi:hypothetical protein